MASAAACPVCGRPVLEKFKPFCSKRCADVDLGRWLGEAYVLPGNSPLEGMGEDAGDRVIAFPKAGSDGGDD